MFCDIVNLDGTPFQGCPRHVLRRTLDRAHDRGFTFFAAPEIEYFYFADADPSHPPVTLDSGSYFELTVADRASDLRQRTVLTLEEMGIPVEHAQHEDAPSQHEIDLRYTDALTMADTVMTVRLVVKEMARQQGVHRQLHAQAAGRRPGLGHAHPHVAVPRATPTPSSTPSDPDGLSEVAEAVHRRPAPPRPRDHRGDQPVGQLLQAAGLRLRGPHPRLVGPQQPLGPGPGAGGQARASSSRPGSSTGRPTAPATPTWPSPSSWPPGSRASRRATSCPPRPTPTSSPSAPRSWPTRASCTCRAASTRPSALMESSELLAETLGEHVFEWFIRNKRAEWAEYKAHVTQFELDRYLPLL